MSFAPVLDEVSSNNVDAIRTRFVRGEFVNQIYRRGITPLMLARSVEMAELLMEYGAQVNVKSSSGKSPIMYACQEGDSALFFLLLSYGANIHDTDIHLNNCLMEATIGKSREIVLYLLKFISVNSFNSTRWTPLMKAVFNDTEEMVTLLLDNGADINQQTIFGNTAIHAAARHGRPTILRTLLFHGGNPNIQNVSHKTAYELCSLSNCKLVLHLYYVLKHKVYEANIAFLLCHKRARNQEKTIHYDQKNPLGCLSELPLHRIMHYISDWKEWK